MESESLAQEIQRTPSLADRPDLIIRLVDLIFFLSEKKEIPS